MTRWKSGELISERCWLDKIGQSWRYQRTSSVTRGGQYDSPQRIRVDIRRNAHDDQSHARVELWAKDRWSAVVDVPITELACARLWYGQEIPATVAHFRADAAKLEQEAMCVLWGPA